MIRKLRGTVAEQIAVLGPAEPSSRNGEAAAPAKKKKAPLAKIAERQAQLKRERREAAEHHDARIARSGGGTARAEAAYQEALQWRG